VKSSHTHSRRGDPEAGLVAALFRLNLNYTTTPVEHHSPIEPHAMTALRGG
jgi:hypothetical protein